MISYIFQLKLIKLIAVESDRYTDLYFEKTIKIKAVTLFDKKFCYHFRRNNPPPSKSICLISPWPIQTKFGILLNGYILIAYSLRRVFIGKVKNIIPIEPGKCQSMILINIQISFDLIIIKVIGKRKGTSEPSLFFEPLEVLMHRQPYQCMFSFQKSSRSLHAFPL